MKTIMLVRLKPHDPKKGLLLKQYTYQGIRFQAGRGWYKVNGQVAAYLESVHSVPGDNDTPLAFDVCTPDEARAMDEDDRKAARRVVPAEQALDVSHVGDEQPRAKSRPGHDRDDALRRQRRDSDRTPENRQPDALDDDDMEDETPRRRPSRRLAGAVSRRLRAVVENFGELDDGDDPEDDDVEDEAPRCRARRGRALGMPSRRLWADDEELDDVEPGDEVDEFDDDELDGDEFDDEREDTPPRSRRSSSLPTRRRAPQARRIQRYAVEHNALDDDDREIRHVRGPRQAETLDALRNRNARRMRRQHILEDRYAELPRSWSQGRYQDELHIRHARQMAAKLEEIDALDDAMSYGDAEDSLPNNAKRNRHDSHGDAEDSLPTTTRSKHVSQRDAEDSLPGRATRYGDAEDSLPGKGARNRHSGHGDAEDSLSTRDRHSYGDAEDSLPHRRMQHQDAPSSRHTADAQDDLDAVDQEPDRRNVEKPARSDARSQRAQQSPSSAAHDELDALDDALDDRLEKASEDQRPGSAQPQHGQQRTGSSTQCSPEGAHGATSGADARHEGQPWPDDDPFVNRDTRHQAPAPGHEPVAAAVSPRQGRRIYVPGPNTRADASEAQNRQPQPGRQRRTV
jgi:hypothetical protein